MSKNPMEELMRELVRQGWRVETAQDRARAKAFPPDPSKPMVSLSTRRQGGASRGFANAVAELRRSGFVWPPPEPPRSQPSQPEPPAASAPEAAPAPASPSALDQAFADLKEARMTADEAIRAEREAADRLAEAAAEHEKAEADLTAALKLLEQVRWDFDKVFGGVR